MPTVVFPITVPALYITVNKICTITVRKFPQSFLNKSVIGCNNILKRKEPLLKILSKIRVILRK